MGREERKEPFQVLPSASGVNSDAGYEIGSPESGTGEDRACPKLLWGMADISGQE